VEVNQWIHDHPELVLGRMRLGRGRDDELLVLPARPVEATPPTALEQITSHASMAGLTASPTTSTGADLPSPVLEVAREVLIEATEDGTSTRSPYSVPSSQAAELRALQPTCHDSISSQDRVSRHAGGIHSPRPALPDAGG
jgi:hypothetical protein